MLVVTFWNFFICYCSFIVSPVGFPSTSGQKKQEDYFPLEGDHKSESLVSPPERPKGEGRTDVKYSTLLYCYICLLIIF